MHSKLDPTLNVSNRLWLGRLPESVFGYEQAAGNPRHCWYGRGVVLRRNREWAGTENEKPPQTGVPGVLASVAPLPETAPALGRSKKRKGEQS
jgi:hypothetical protein